MSRKRSKTTPSASSKASKRRTVVLRQKEWRMPPGSTQVVYSMTNQPMFGYNLSACLDKGLKPCYWTSSRLKEQVMYMETRGKERYELRLDGVDSKTQQCLFTLSRVKLPLQMESDSATIPLAKSKVDVVAKQITWDFLVWGESSLQAQDQLIEGLRGFFWRRMSACDYVLVPSQARAQ